MQNYITVIFLSVFLKIVHTFLTSRYNLIELLVALSSCMFSCFLSLKSFYNALFWDCPLSILSVVSIVEMQGLFLQIPCRWSLKQNLPEIMHGNNQF